jgi:hypothetical protein
MLSMVLQFYLPKLLIKICIPLEGCILEFRIKRLGWDPRIHRVGVPLTQLCPRTRHNQLRRRTLLTPVTALYITAMR